MERPALRLWRAGLPAVKLCLRGNAGKVVGRGQGSLGSFLYGLQTTQPFLQWHLYMDSEF